MDWDCCGFKKRGLQDVTKIEVVRFVRIGTVIQSFYSNFLADAEPAALVYPEQATLFVTELKGIIEDCKLLKLPKTESLLECTIFDYSHAQHSQAQLQNTVICINTVFTRELSSEHIFVQFDPGRVRYLTTPEEFAVTPIFGQSVASSFSTAMEDARNAGICFATYRHTACVFHCMRIVEKGLVAMANMLNVPFAIPFEYQNWHNIIEAIESKVRDYEKQTPAGALKTETLKFYSQASSQFFYFKAAWRNHVAHSRDTYSSEQALTILTHVGDFMKYLADGGLHD